MKGLGALWKPNAVNKLKLEGATSVGDVWCTDDAFALAMKIDGTKSDFDYDSVYWTDTTKLFGTVVDDGVSQAKYDVANKMRASTVRLVNKGTGAMAGGAGAGKSLDVKVGPNKTLLEVTTNATRVAASKASASEWKDLVPSTFGDECNLLVTNLAIDLVGIGRTRKARLGFITSDSVRCDDGDLNHLVGIGLDRNGQLAAGAAFFDSNARPPSTVRTRTWMFVYVK
jgi:hypothetical protein